MNETKIEWCDVTWNPVTGCKRGCEYCCARRIAERLGKMKWPANELHVLEQPKKRTTKDGKEAIAAYPFGFEPTLHRYRLREPARKTEAHTIFVCPMADLFGPWVPEDWIAEVLKVCLLFPQHRYLFLTKYPERYLELYETGLLPCRDNFWYGSTTTHPEMNQIMYLEHLNTFVNVELLQGPFGPLGATALEYIDWFIIGAENGSRKGKPLAKKAWVQQIVDCCQEAGKPVFMKNSLISIVGEGGMSRGFPW